MCGTRYDTQKQTHKIHRQCFACGYKYYENLRVGTVAVILHHNKLLLVKRNNEPQKDVWDLPGGFAEPNEHPEKTMLRELKEELNLDGKIEKLFGIYAVNFYEWQGKMNYVCDIVYEISVTHTEFQPQDDVSEYKWFELNELPEASDLAFSTTRDIVDKQRK